MTGIVPERMVLLITLNRPTAASVTSIDLNPQAKHVQKYDFFDFPLPGPDDKLYDVLGLSLVLNFVGDLRKRGKTLSPLRPSPCKLTN